VDNTVVDAARQALGPVGACLPVSFSSTPSADVQREAVGRLERAGYRAVWTNEVLLPIGIEFASGIRQLEQLAPVLAELG
jgi:hypothetical protein